MASTSAAPAPDREEIVFLDVETSTRPRVLLEFGAVVVCSRRLVDVSSFATLVRPANLDALPDPTARSNGITRGTLADAPPFRDVADMVYDVLHGRVWAGHNIVHFDSMIIRDAFAEIGRPPPQPKAMIDTQYIIMYITSDVNSHYFAICFKLLTAAGKLGKLFWSREAKAQEPG